jgi:hypothetical protein
MNLLAFDFGEDVLLITGGLFEGPAEFDKKSANLAKLVAFGVTVSLIFNFIALLVFGNKGRGS